MGKKKPSKPQKPPIVINRKASHDYYLERAEISAGLVLQGWEVKALRDNRVQLRDSYIHFKRGEAWLIGCHITPLSSASTHITPAPARERKLLLHKREISQLRGAVERQGMTVVAKRLYWSKQQRAKIEITTARGKKHHDKRQSEHDRDWARQQQQLLKSRW